MKTILLPTDFSKNSINAIEYAMELFKNVPCNFYILNVQKASSFISDDMMVVSSSATIYNTIIDAAKKSISNIISSIKKTNSNKDHHFFSVVDYDNFIDSINQSIEKHQVDLIVMGTKGASGLEKVIFGSNTVRVMQRCKAPVLAIPDGCRFSTLNKVGFTTNHQTLFNIDELQPLNDMLELHHSKLNVLHIADENHLVQKQELNKDFFSTYFGDAKHEYMDTNSKKMFQAVQQYLVGNDIKLLAMMSEKHSFLERLFTRHLVEIITFSIDIPFLVMESSSSQ